MGVHINGMLCKDGDKVDITVERNQKQHKLGNAEIIVNGTSVISCQVWSLDFDLNRPDAPRTVNSLSLIISGDAEVSFAYKEIE
jgi:hypothetical protein